ncbi:MAG TPA: hypothetical protein VGE77_11325 [Nocardioides sp.]
MKSLYKKAIFGEGVTREEVYAFHGEAFVAFVLRGVGLGLIAVTTVPLREVAELDRRFGMSPGHESRPQHLVTGRTPLR